MLFEAQAGVMRKALGIRSKRAHKILDFPLCVAATERIHAAGDIEFVGLALHLIPQVKPCVEPAKPGARPEHARRFIREGERTVNRHFQLAFYESGDAQK
jgi:hypothetical protein